MFKKHLEIHKKTVELFDKKPSEKLIDGLERLGYSTYSNIQGYKTIQIIKKWQLLCHDVSCNIESFALLA